MDEKKLSLIRLLNARLERIPADSLWAHRASGVRGSLLRILEEIENDRPVQKSKMRDVVEMGFSVLEHASIEKYR
jgi:hypothetical protein